MAIDPWETSSDDIEVVRAHLRGPVSAAAPATTHWLPVLHQVLATHIEDGWVHLSFIGWPLRPARAVADQLLHPDALPVSGSDLVGRAAPAFEGFGWDDDPPAAVIARRGEHPSPPSLRAEATPPAAIDTHEIVICSEDRPS